MNDTLQMIHTVVAEMDPGLDPSDEAYKVAVVLLASAQVGTDVMTVSQLTEYSVEWVQFIGDRLTASGVWKDGYVCADWLDPEHGSINFWLDVAVGEGFLQAVE